MRIAPFLVLGVLGAVACGGGASDGSGGSHGESASASTGAGGKGADLTCIGNVSLTPVSDAQGPVQLVFTGALGSSIAPVSGAHVVACGSGDALCAMSLGAGETAADGTVTLTLPFGPNGFTGFTLASKQGYFTMVSASSVPLLAMSPNRFGEVEQSAGEAFFKQGFSAALDGAMGQLVIDAEDCAGNAAAGLTVKVSGVDATGIVYVQGSHLAKTATQTDASGMAAAANVTPGMVTVETRVAGTDELLGNASVLIRGGAITEVHMAPTP